jgi:ELWxxDGT repeat protein
MKRLLLFIILISFLTSAWAQKPQLLKDINADTTAIDYYDSKVLEYNGKGYFSADDGIHGIELWVTDGTTAGTELVTDIMPGSGSSYVRSRTVFNNLIYFSAYDTIHGMELWATDGTSGGTFLVKDIYPGFNGNLPNGSGPNNFFIYNNKLYFSALDAAHGNELWSSDGTDAGTALVKDLNPGPGFGSCSGFIEYNGIMLFSARDNVHGYELWRSDGTDSGTYLVKDINPGVNDGYPLGQWCNYNNKTYFRAMDGVHGFELWESDGTESGTHIVLDLYPGNGSGYPSAITSYQNEMFFSGTDSAYGRELFKSDGTAAGTLLVKDIIPGVTGSFPSPQIFHNGKLYFKTNEPTYGSELWVSDGTDSGTHIVSDLRPGIAGSSPENFISFGSQFYFIAASNTTDGWQLFRYNDSTNIVSMVVPDQYDTNACADADGDFQSVPCVAIGMLFYPARYDSNLDGEFYTVQQSPIGIDELREKINFSIYPVPASSQISIELQENQPATVIIFNALGEKILSRQFNENVLLDISSFVPGIFTVQLITTRGVGVKAFVKE